MQTRYQRQIALKELGEAGQQKLLQAKILVIGAGGLGCPALQYLAAAGVGVIGIVDGDIVALSNLHRQIIYTSADIGKRKTDCAAKTIAALNDNVSVVPYSFRITNDNALPIINEYDVVIDATDNMATRYLLNDACYLLKKPLVHGSISRFEGQLAVFNCNNSSITYRDLFPQQPADAEVISCNEAGVMGMLCGIIGSMQAAEAVKIICGIGNVAVGKLITFNMLTNTMYDFSIAPNPAVADYLPINQHSFTKHNYELANVCAAAQEIDPATFDSMLLRDDVLIIDVREHNELPFITAFACSKIPLHFIEPAMNLAENNAIVVFCQSGKRSREAAAILSKRYKNVYSLKDGIVNWLRLKEKEHA